MPLQPSVALANPGFSYVKCRAVGLLLKRRAARLVDAPRGRGHIPPLGGGKPVRGGGRWPACPATGCGRTAFGAGATRAGALTDGVSPGNHRAERERSGDAERTSDNPPGTRPTPRPCRSPTQSACLRRKAGMSYVSTPFSCSAATWADADSRELRHTAGVSRPL